MATTPAPLAQLATECETEGLTVPNAERIAAELAAQFSVQHDEVGILRVEKDSLVFVYPTRLQNVGRIPLNTSSSVAVRTFNTRRGEVSNSFAQTRHTTFFEMVALEKPGVSKKASREKQVIQKLMSAPVVAGAQSVGVIQICRKAPNPLEAGPDFVPADLQKLVAIANTLAKCFK
jgi:hypothetical protein